MAQLLSLFLGLLAVTGPASASVTVRKTGMAPTGYEVDFKYTNPTARRVLVGGHMPLFTDQYHSSPLVTDGNDFSNVVDANGHYPPSEYQAGDFYVTYMPADYQDLPYEMRSTGNGEWTLTTPLPSGTWSYAYCVDVDYIGNCSVATGSQKVDPDHPPFENTPGQQETSSFHVPFDKEFQFREGQPYCNFDFALDAPKEAQGIVQTVNYTSPGSIWPAPDVHAFSIYLPAEYGKVEGKKYPLLYLSHGAGDNGATWQNAGRASAILDNLIHEGHIAPTVVVMPSFSNLTASNDTGLPFNLPWTDDIRENFKAYLFPWIEDNYQVCQEPSCRAFAGLSWGGRLAYDMYVNNTEYFDYFGLFSPATGSPYITASSVAAKPCLGKKGLFVGYGLYDPIFPVAREMQRALDKAGVGYLNRISPFGGHSFNTWQDNLWLFGVKALWKPIPFTKNTGRRNGHEER